MTALPTAEAVDLKPDANPAPAPAPAFVKPVFARLLASAVVASTSATVLDRKPLKVGKMETWPEATSEDTGHLRR
ncbi:hypothetical protein ACFPRL_30450 [Pseudoclavibacter helvolus]